MSKKSRTKNEWEKLPKMYDESDEDDSDDDAALEEAGLAEDSGGEQLQMYVVKLNHWDQAGLIGYVLDSFRPGTGDVNGESEKVLTLWVSSDGCIVGLAPPPGCHVQPGFGVEYGERTRDEYAIDLQELSE